MAEPQKPDQSTPAPISVHSGGVESTPISSVREEGSEPRIESAPGIQPPELSEAEKNAGVRYVPINPPISPEAQKAGVSQSMPAGSNFPVPDFPSVSSAQEVAKSASIEESKPWRATEWLKNFFRERKAA